MTTNQTNLASTQVITADGPLPVLWLCGAPGSGKSATAWELFSTHQEEQLAYVDIDQLKMLAAGPSDPFDLAVALCKASKAKVASLIRAGVPA